MNIKTICLLGDSVLDDFYWLKDPTQDVRAQLAQIMPKDRVYNFAVDESRVVDVLYGCQPRAHYQAARKQFFGDSYDYPCSENGKVYPLQLIDQVQPTHVVLSVGGNDGRVHLSQIVWSAESLIQAVLNDNFIANAEKLIEKILQGSSHSPSPPNLILVFVYKPYKEIFTWYKEVMMGSLSCLPVEGLLNLPGRLDYVYDKLREIFLRLATKYQVPVIDLSQTFDSNNPKHYGTTPIEPSNLSGMTIAKLIRHVVEKHDFLDKSRIYWAPNCGNKVKSKINIPGNEIMTSATSCGKSY